MCDKVVLDVPKGTSRPYCLTQYPATLYTLVLAQSWAISPSNVEGVPV